MHPFLPVLSVVFLVAADAALLFLRLNAGVPEVAAHATSAHTVAIASLMIGLGLAVWLRRFGVLYPSWVAILSLAGVVAIRFV